MSNSKRVPGRSTNGHIAALICFLVAWALLLAGYLGSAVYPNIVPGSTLWLLQVWERDSPAGRKWKFDTWRWCNESQTGVLDCASRTAMWSIDGGSLGEGAALALPSTITNSLSITAFLVLFGLTTHTSIVIFSLLCPAEQPLAIGGHPLFGDMVIHKNRTRMRMAYYLRGGWRLSFLAWEIVWIVACLGTIGVGIGELPPRLEGGLGTGACLYIASLILIILGQCLIWGLGLRVDKKFSNKSRASRSSTSGRKQSSRGQRARPATSGSRA